MVGIGKAGAWWALTSVERKSVKRDGHFTARGQRARGTVDSGPIVGCGSRPAFVDPAGTVCARAGRSAFTPREGGAVYGKLRKLDSAQLGGLRAQSAYCILSAVCIGATSNNYQEISEPTLSNNGLYY